ncbi:MAG: glycosyltransferase [Elusimicrobiota bacterium]
MLYVLLPCYNEEKSLPPLLGGIRRTLAGSDHKVLIVDDGSADGTARVVEEWSRQMPLEIIRHGENKGLGAAMETGFAALATRLNDHDMVVVMDADNTHDPSLIPAMVGKSTEGFSIVIASRFAGEGKEVGLAFHRKFLSRGAGAVLRLFFPVDGVSDYTCGYRLYTGMVLKEGLKNYGGRLVEERGFACMVEILIKLTRMLPRGAVAEVPLVLRYDLKEGESKMRVFRTIFRYIILCFRLKGALSAPRRGRVG